MAKTNSNSSNLHDDVVSFSYNYLCLLNVLVSRLVWHLLTLKRTNKIVETIILTCLSYNPSVTYVLPKKIYNVNKYQYKFYQIF